MITMYPANLPVSSFPTSYSEVIDKIVEAISTVEILNANMNSGQNNKNDSEE